MNIIPMYFKVIVFVVFRLVVDAIINFFVFTNNRVNHNVEYIRSSEIG